MTDARSSATNDHDPKDVGKMSVADYEDQYGYDAECCYCGKTYRTSDRTYRPYCRFMCQFTNELEPGE